MNYRIRFHPHVERDLDAIAHWILDYAGPDAAARKLAEIEAAIATLKATPHKGSLRDEIAPGLRAIPAGRKAVIAFVVDDDAVEVLATLAGRTKGSKLVLLGAPFSVVAGSGRGENRRDVGHPVDVDQPVE